MEHTPVLKPSFCKNNIRDHLKTSSVSRTTSLVKISLLLEAKLVKKTELVINRVELNLWTMIPMSTTTRAMLDPEADEVDGETDAEGLY